MEHLYKVSTSTYSAPLGPRIKLGNDYFYTPLNGVLLRRGTALTHIHICGRIFLNEFNCALPIGAQIPPRNSFLFLTDIKKTGEISISRSFFFYRKNTRRSAQPPRPIHIWPILLGNFERNARRVGLLIYRTNTKGNQMATVSLRDIHKGNLQNGVLQKMYHFTKSGHHNRGCLAIKM